MDLIWLIICLIVLGLVIAFFLSKSKSTDKSPSRNDDIKPQSKNEEPQIDLVKLNLRIRKAALDKGVTESAENVIDQLIELIPAINQSEMAGTDLKWTVNQIATEYLPNKCIGPYLNLSPELRAQPEKISTVLENLNALSKELLDVDKLLTSRDENEFKKKATFLKHRFNQNGDA